MKRKYKTFVAVILVSLCVFFFMKGMIGANTPTIVWWSNIVPLKKSRIAECGYFRCHISSVAEDIEKVSIEADAYLFYGSKFDLGDIPLPRSPLTKVWGILHEESPRNNELFLSEYFLNLFNYSSTFSRYSDVPITFQYLENKAELIDHKYFISTQKKDKLLKNVAPILYLQSDCETATDRDEYVLELMKYIQIDSYGKCLRNKVLQPILYENYLNNLYKDELMRLTAQYKFTIAIENGVCHDYITEKFWRPIIAGSVPIYYGSPKIRDFFPNNESAILVEDFDSPKALAVYLNYLMLNTSAYEKHLRHKLDQKIHNINLIKAADMERDISFNFQKVIEKFEIFICCQLHSNTKGHTVSKLHYNCPKPISPLTHKIAKNMWVSIWDEAQKKGKQVYNAIFRNESMQVIKSLGLDLNL